MEFSVCIVVNKPCPWIRGSSGPVHPLHPNVFRATCSFVNIRHLCSGCKLPQKYLRLASIGPSVGERDVLCAYIVSLRPRAFVHQMNYHSGLMNYAAQEPEDANQCPT